jgi:hypothetical protein
MKWNVGALAHILLVAFVCQALATPELLAQNGESPLLLRAPRGVVGERASISLHARAGAIDFSGDVFVQGRIFLSNPTVFYPENWIQPANVRILTRSLTRLNDSVWTFGLSLSCLNAAAACDTLAFLRGELLAPSDSVTDVRLFDMVLTDAQGARRIAPTSATLTVESIGAPLPIVRIPRLEQNAPNPVPRGSAAVWAYRIDEESDVSFVIYCPLGREIDRIERPKQPRGAHVESWTPTTLVSGGVYFVRFRSGGGEIVQKFIVY